VTAFCDWFRTHRGAKGTHSSALRPRRHRSTSDARRGCQPMECTGPSRLSSGTSQSVSEGDNEVTHPCAPRVSAVS
jgi:hypothetical protein